MPGKPYNQRVGCRPNSSLKNFVTDPDNPNIRISASPITKGGVMIGKIVKARTARRYLKPDRVTTSAKASPRTVVKKPTQIAKNSEFHATPQRPVPVRQLSPHNRSSKNFSAKTINEYDPSWVINADINMLTIGKKTNAPTIAITNPIALTTNTSPFIAPRAAMPCVNRNRNELARNNPP